MKARWRQFEWTFAGVLAACLIGKNILTSNWPQLMVLLAIFGGYALLNLLVVKRIHFAWVALAALAGVVGVAITVQMATEMSRAWEVNYQGYGVLALFGYNDVPFDIWHRGMDRALIMAAVLLPYLYIREYAIAYLEKPIAARPYYLDILNQVSGQIVGFSCAVMLLFTTDAISMEVLLSLIFVFFIPALIYSTGTLYWIFPRLETGGVEWKKWLPQLVVLVLLSSLPTFIPFAKQQHPKFYWIYAAMLLTVGTAVCWLFYKAKRDRILELRAMKSQLEKSKVDLQQLRAQINPHFLFNTLNSLYGSALKENANQTAEAIQKLGDMMRFMLHDNQKESIPLSKEIDYLNDYLALQQLRIQSSPGIRISSRLDNGCGAIPVPPMLLLPLVENAFKHGISLQAPSFIDLRLTCKDGTVQFEVRNSLHEQHRSVTESTGIGLHQVRERLKHAYPGKHRFHAAAVDQEFLASIYLEVK